MPVTPRTTALFERLKAMQVDDAHPAVDGIRRALGIWPGDEATDETYPVLGFHLSATRQPVNLTCYLVTPGKFARYEWALEGSLLFVCGIDRVVSVTERTAGETLTLTVELDAQSSSTVLQAQSGPGPDGSLGSVAQMRHERAQYVLHATDDVELLALTDFSLGLRTALGV